MVKMTEFWGGVSDSSIQSPTIVRNSAANNKNRRNSDIEKIAEVDLGVGEQSSKCQSIPDGSSLLDNISPVNDKPKENGVVALTTSVDETANNFVDHIPQQIEHISSESDHLSTDDEYNIDENVRIFETYPLNS